MESLRSINVVIKMNLNNNPLLFDNILEMKSISLEMVLANLEVSQSWKVGTDGTI